VREMILTFLLLAAAPPAQDVTVSVSTESDGTRTLVHEIVVPAAVEEVWQAVSTEEGWQTWAVPVVRQVAGSPDRFETSYDPGAAPGSAATIEQQWGKRERPRRVEFRTTRTPDGFPHAEAYVRVTSTFELAPEGEKATRLRLVGTGYAPGAEGDELLAFFREGNRMSLEQLHRRFTKGPIDWKKPSQQEEE